MSVFNELEKGIETAGENGSTVYYDIAAIALPIYQARKTGQINIIEEAYLHALRKHKVGFFGPTIAPSYNEERCVPRRP